MNLPHGWHATFFDVPKRIVLTKPTRQPGICLQWEPPFLKAVDPASGVLITGLTVSLPDDVRQPLIEAARERWGA